MSSHKRIPPHYEDEGIVRTIRKLMDYRPAESTREGMSEVASHAADVNKACSAGYAACEEVYSHSFSCGLVQVSTESVRDE